MQGGLLLKGGTPKALLSQTQVSSVISVMAHQSSDNKFKPPEGLMWQLVTAYSFRMHGSLK